MPLQTRGCELTISLIPVSFPVGSFGLEEGRGGGISAPVVSGVVGLFGAVITQKHAFDWLEEKKESGNKYMICVHIVQVFFPQPCFIHAEWRGSNSKNASMFRLSIPLYEELLPIYSRCY